MTGSVWAVGDYRAIARDVLAPLGAELVVACGAGRGDRLLDVGAGTGNVAIAAALEGAEVVALDPTPELIAIGREQATERGAEVEWVEGDAQRMPFDDASFDVVLSCLGAMFAPDHRATADELVRVCRPGGRIGLVAWQPAGHAADLMRVVGRHAPPPPPGVGSPIAWGDEGHLRDLFGDRLTDVQHRPGLLHPARFGDADEVAAFMTTSFGPAVALAEKLPAERRAELHADIGAWAGRAVVDGRWRLEYVVTVARRA